MSDVKLLSLAAAAAATVVVPVEKTSVTCENQYHDGCQCEKNFHDLIEKYNKNSWWYPMMLNPEYPWFLLIAQACMILNGHQQEMALEIFEKIKYGDDITPQMVMDAVKLWNEICDVALSIGRYGYKPNRKYFLTEAGCFYWMDDVEKISKQTSEATCEATCEETCEDDHECPRWNRILSNVTKTFIDRTHTTQEIIIETYLCTHSVNCRMCRNLGY